MGLADQTVSTGGAGSLGVGSIVSQSVAIPNGRWWNAWIDMGPYSPSAQIGVTLHAPGGNLLFTSGSPVTIGGITFLRMPLVSSQPENKSLNGCAGTTVTIDIELLSGSSQNFTSGQITLQPDDTLVQADTWQGTLAATWAEGNDVWFAAHLSPRAHIGDGANGWETAVKIGGGGLGVYGTTSSSKPYAGWLMFVPDGGLFVSPWQGNLNGVWKNRLGGTGTSSDWSKTNGAGPYTVSRDSLHCYVGRSREHNWRFFCTDGDVNPVLNRNHFIYCQQGLVEACGYLDNNSWTNLKDPPANDYLTSTPVAGNVRGKTFGACFVENGYAVLFTDDTEGGVYWKFVGDPSPIAYDDVGNPSDRTPWPADPGVLTGLSGQVCGMARNTAGAIVALLWDGSSVTAARTLDSSGQNWETFSTGLPALDLAPYILADEEVFYILYMTTIAPGLYDRPKFMASVDGGATWS